MIARKKIVSLDDSIDAFEDDCFENFAHCREQSDEFVVDDQWVIVFLELTNDYRSWAFEDHEMMICL